MPSELPDWLTLTAAQIANDSRLQPFMLQANFDQAQMETDIAAKMPAQADVVEMRLRAAAAPHSWPFTSDQWTTAYPGETSDARDRRDAGQKRVAGEVVKELVIAALLRVLPGEDNAAMVRALMDGNGESPSNLARLGSAESMLKALECDVRAVGTLVTVAGAKRPKRRGCIFTGRGDYV